MIAECACARATWRMAPGRVKCACSRNHVAQLSLHEEKRGSHRSRANFCCRGQFRFLAATEMSTQPDETPPFTPEQHAWLLEVFGPGGSSETRDGTAHHTAPTGSNPEEGPPSQPPTFSQPATSGSGERLRRRATRGGVVSGVRTVARVGAALWAAWLRVSTRRAVGDTRTHSGTDSSNSTAMRGTTRAAHRPKGFVLQTCITIDIRSDISACSCPNSGPVDHHAALPAVRGIGVRAQHGASCRPGRLQALRSAAAGPHAYAHAVRAPRRHIRSTPPGRVELGHSRPPPNKYY